MEGVVVVVIYLSPSFKKRSNEMKKLDVVEIVKISKDSAGQGIWFTAVLNNGVNYWVHLTFKGGRIVIEMSGRENRSE